MHRLSPLPLWERGSHTLGTRRPLSPSLSHEGRESRLIFIVLQKIATALLPISTNSFHANRA